LMTNIEFSRCVVNYLCAKF